MGVTSEADEASEEEDARLPPFGLDVFIQVVVFFTELTRPDGAAALKALLEVDAPTNGQLADPGSMR